MHKRVISAFLKLLVTVGLFLLLFRPQTFGLRPDQFGGVTPLRMWQELRAAEPSHIFFWLGLAIIIKLSGMFAGVVRWRLLLQGQGLDMPFGYLVQSWFVGRFFGIFVPGTVGLDGYRLYDSSRYTGDIIRSASVIAVEKLIGFISLTFLVFVTFPLGFRLLSFKLPVLAITLAGLGLFVVVSFLLLLNPRVIQILVAILPTPMAIRNKVDKLGAAITAYSGKRRLLLTAVACGLWVHLSTCFMFACTMMSLRAANTSLVDILFASPIMIYGTVVGPSIGGEGIREIVFAVLLGPKTGVVTAVLFGHLGWWVGDVVPFLIGAPIFFLRSRPEKKRLEAELASARRELAAVEHIVHLAPAETSFYRGHLIRHLCLGLGAGLIVGALIALVEAYWLKISLASLTEFSAFVWGPIAYGILFASVGCAIGVALLFIGLLLGRFLPSALMFALSFGGTMASGGIILLFRFSRDVLHDHAPSHRELAGLLIVIGGVALVSTVVGGLFALMAGRRRIVARMAVPVVYLVLVGLGVMAAYWMPVSANHTVFQPSVVAKGPNIILIAADALRADYLPMYASGNIPVAAAPNLQAFARDAVLYKNAFAQASWTKPSFASLFTSRYPSCHTATTEVSALPEGMITFPLVLENNGYYTKGFANNGNIASVFQFNRGFVDYVDLKPSRYFHAGYSASKLALYEVLRHGRHAIVSKFSKKIRVTDFYQPAETVTHEALSWLDGPAKPANAPFFLFLHYMDPHDPFMDHHHPGVGYARASNQHPDPEDFLEPMRNAYLSEIEYMDHYLGKLFEGLRERNLYDDTVIVFMADHGEEFYDHNGWWHGQTLYDELVHVPMIFKLPKNGRGGTVNTDFARIIDVGPTLLSLANLLPDPQMQGKSFFSDSGEFANGDIASVYAETDFENNSLQAVRSHDAKVIFENAENPRKLPPQQFYDLTKDPREQANQFGKGDPRQTQLTDLLNKMRETAHTCAGEPAANTRLTDELKDQLNGIGYLNGN